MRTSIRTSSVSRSARRMATGLLAVVALAGTACSGGDSDNSVPSVPASESYAASLGVNLGTMTKKSDALYVQDVVVGTGAEAIAGRSLTMNYTGYFTNGQMFDTSVGRGPIVFTLGTGEVIKGWDQGIAGMKVGGKRKIVIGSELAYGRAGRGSIGPNKTLVFDVELLAVQ